MGPCVLVRLRGVPQEKLPGRILFVGHGASCLGIAEAFGREDYAAWQSRVRSAASAYPSREKWLESCLFLEDLSCTFQALQLCQLSR